MNAHTSVPKITTVEQAIELLHQCLDLSSLGNAVEYLEQRELRYQLLSLYSHFFPQQYAQSEAAVYPCLEEDDGLLKYTEREIEFLQLVHRDLFPLNYLLRSMGGIIHRTSLFDPSVRFSSHSALETLSVCFAHV